MEIDTIVESGEKSEESSNEDMINDNN